jgi:hypothetical protein
MSCASKPEIAADLTGVDPGGELKPYHVEDVGIMSARATLLGMVGHRDSFTLPQSELVPLQLEAARELFAERREQLPILDRRARETGVDRIDTLNDLIPLLFSHTAFKSYPNAFVQNGQWDRMTKWLGTMTTRPMDGVDLDGVADIDDWVSRLWAAGHLVNTTSGTSGKVSFLNRSRADDALLQHYLQHLCWPEPVKPEGKHHIFFMGPRTGPYLMLIAANHVAKLYGRPDSLHYLSNDALRLTDIMRMAETRLKMAEGRASPSEIAALEESGRAKSAEMAGRFSDMIGKIIALRHEPMIITGGWTQMWEVMNMARAAGVPNADFHPDTIIQSGGGLKGAKLPTDYREQLFEFFGPVRTQQGYGMSEMSVGFPMDEDGYYHQVPWIIPFVLDRDGVKPVGPREGMVEGRYAYLDLSNEARWNGLITGDRVTLDFRETRPETRLPGLVIHPEISRYADIGEEDKIGCAGTIDAYISGEIGA